MECEDYLLVPTSNHLHLELNLRLQYEQKLRQAVLLHLPEEGTLERCKQTLRGLLHHE